MTGFRPGNSGWPFAEGLSESPSTTNTNKLDKGSLMKQFLVAASAAALFSAATVSHATPAAFLGLSYHFGGKLGFTAKVLSSNAEKKSVAGFGATYYFNAKDPFGLDLSVGRTMKHSAVLVGYDFLQKQPALSAGWANTKKHCPPDYILEGGECVMD